MNKSQKKEANETRKDYLYRVAVEYLRQLNATSDALATTIVYDDIDCDGLCLLEDMEELLNK